MQSKGDRIEGFTLTAILAAATIVSGVSALSCFFGKLGAAKDIPLILPERADVQSARDVQPGTFTVTVPLREFLNRAQRSDRNTLVSYGPEPRMPVESAKRVVVRYWLPRTDVPGTFYYAEAAYPVGTWSSIVGTIHREGNTLIVSPTHDVVRGFFLVLVATILGFLTRLAFRANRQARTA